MNLSTLLKLAARRSAPRRKRRCPAEVNLLEGRLLLATDLTAPVTTIQVVPDTLNSRGYYTASPETIKLLASDPDSPNGLSTFYNVDNTGFVAGNAFNLTDGNHTVQFYSVDASGNREATHTQAFNIDSTVPVLTVSASPSRLFPPNHKIIRATISGHVSDASGGVPNSVRYTILDEQNPSRPTTGTARVDANGDYAFTVPLQASRSGQDKDGRQYTIVVSSTDEAGNTGSTTTVVTVLHDRGNHSGTDDDGSGSGQGNTGSGDGTRGPGKTRQIRTNKGRGKSKDDGKQHSPTPAGPIGNGNQGEDKGQGKDKGDHGNSEHGNNGDHGNGHGKG